MWQWLSSWFSSPEQQRLASLREQVEARALEAQLGLLGDLVDPREPVIDDLSFVGGTVLGDLSAPYRDGAGRGEALPVYTNEGQLKLLRDQSRRLCALNEFAINALGNRQSYICWKGYQYKLTRKTRPGEQPPQGPDHVAQQGQLVIDDFLARNRWGEREQESVHRTDRDGESIVRLFHVGRGLAEARFVEPEHLRGHGSSDPQATFGVITEPGDVEKVLAYLIAEDPQENLNTTEVKAEDVFHFKLNVDSSAKRGLPTFHPVRKNLQRAEALLRNMSILAQTQATFALIRKHKQYGKSAIDAFRRDQQDDTYRDPYAGKDQPFKRFLPGSIVDTNEFTDYDFPAARVDAAGLVGVLQAELRAVAARLVMPEWMLTVDSNSANYATALVAEAPSTRNFERLQAYYGGRWGDGPKAHAVLWRVLEIAVSWGRLPPEILTDYVLQAEPPPLTVRNKPQETQRARTLSEAGILSDATWSKWEGLDHAQEQALGAKKQQGPGGPPTPGGPIPGGPPGPPSPPGSAILGEGQARKDQKRPAPGAEGPTWEELREAEEGGGERKVGDVWQGPSGKWFTRNQQGRVVPASDPNKKPEGPEERRARKQKEREEEYRQATSKPPVVRKLGGVSSPEQAAQLDATVEEMFAGDFQPGYVGAQPGSEVRVSRSSSGSLYIGVDHPAIETQSRQISLTPDGELVCKNSMFFLKRKFRGGGLGMKVFSDQVKALAAAGADRIETCAGKGGVMNGYYTWAVLGYDAPLERGWINKVNVLNQSTRNRMRAALAREAAKKEGIGLDEARSRARAGAYDEEAIKRIKAVADAEPRTVQDVIAAPGGKTVWSALGYMTNMTFDLKPGSRSLQALNAYLVSKGKPPIEAPPEAAKLREERKARVAERKAKEAAEAERRKAEGDASPEVAAASALRRSLTDAARDVGISPGVLRDSFHRVRQARPGISEAEAVRRASYDWLAGEAGKAGRDPDKVAKIAEWYVANREFHGFPPQPPGLLYRQAVRNYDSAVAAMREKGIEV